MGPARSTNTIIGLLKNCDTESYTFSIPGKDIDESIKINQSSYQVRIKTPNCILIKNIEMREKINIAT